MRVFLDTFMHYGPLTSNPERIAATALMVKKWTGVFFATPMNGGPDGMNCCALGTLRRTVPQGKTFGASWRFKISAGSGGSFGSGNIFELGLVDTAHQLRTIFGYRLEPDGTIGGYAGDILLSRTTGANALHFDTWYGFEVNVKIGGSALGNVAVEFYSRMDGVGLLNGGGFSNIPGAACQSVSAGCPATSIAFNGTSLGQSYIALPVVYDDLTDVGATWNLNAAHNFGVPPTFWMGPCKGGVVFPDGDVSVDWSSTGAANWDQINGTSPDLAKFVYTDVVSNKDVLTWQDIANLPVMTAQYSLYATKNDAGTRVITQRSGGGSTEIISAQTPLANDPFYVIGGRDNDPATGLRWVKTSFDAKDFGYNLDL